MHDPLSEVRGQFLEYVLGYTMGVPRGEGPEFSKFCLIHSKLGAVNLKESLLLVIYTKFEKTDPPSGYVHGVYPCHTKDNI